MRLLVHTANLTAGGGLQVAASLLEEFSAIPGLYTGVLCTPAQRALFASTPGNLLFFECAQSPTRSLSAAAAFRRRAAAAEQQFRPDKALTVFGPGLWRPSVPHLCGFANGLYLFSGSEFIRRHWPKGAAARLRYRLKRALLLRQLRKEGDRYWTETPESAQALAEALRIDPSRVDVVPNTVSRHFAGYRQEPRGEARWYDLLTFYAPHPHKNLELIAALLPLVQGSNIRFLLTLSPDDFQRLFGHAASSPHLLNLGVIAPEQAPEVYRQADAVFLPSLLETFSATYPEAMATGKPILASDRPFARNICQDAALYFDPLSAEDALQQILRLKQDTVLQAALQAKGQRIFQQMSGPAERAAQIVAILEAMSRTA